LLFSRMNPQKSSESESRLLFGRPGGPFRIVAGVSPALLVVHVEAPFRRDTHDLLITGGSPPLRTGRTSGPGNFYSKPGAPDRDRVVVWHTGADSDPPERTGPPSSCGSCGSGCGTGNLKR
jgi:hypothetical protein